jgi:hypothetical protein
VASGDPVVLWAERAHRKLGKGKNGLVRPDEWAQLTGVSACRNIGFEGELDTHELPQCHAARGELLC